MGGPLKYHGSGRTKSSVVARKTLENHASFLLLGETTARYDNIPKQRPPNRTSRKHRKATSSSAINQSRPSQQLFKNVSRTNLRTKNVVLLAIDLWRKPICVPNKIRGMLVCPQHCKPYLAKNKHLASNIQPWTVHTN